VKKLFKLTAVAAAAVAGVLVWRQVEAKKLEDDLWAEAERLAEQAEKS
jgi:hypothetical protein